MSGKALKILRKFSKNMNYSDEQIHVGKKMFARMSRENRHELLREMRQFNNEQSQSIQGEAA